MAIVQGDNGTIIEPPITDDEGVVSLTGATVTVKIKVKSRTFTKNCTITDVNAGLCEFELTSEDLADAGLYSYQGTVTFDNSKAFSSEPKRFIVSNKM